MDEHNPYHAPAARIAAAMPDEALPIEPAGRWRRLFNLLIDYVGHSIFSIVLSIPYVLYVYLEGGEAAVTRLEEPDLLRDYAIGLASMLVYCILMEGFFGFTLGKLITGTRVVTEAGVKPGWGQVVGRTFARLIPFEPFSLLFSSHRQLRGWHDSLPKTYVVRKR